ncbi:hypothetical protein DFH06DRAFT_85339 [Mycena polygramma]|nr:hypothetical protein DFH06DRAFT_85339 [Mycena polygramma]
MYQGNGAAEWRQEIGAYMSLRHPNIIQIYGTASSSDLIPFEHWLDPYKPFPCLTVYIYSYYHRQYRASISGSEAAAVVSGYTPRIMEGLAINVLTLEAYHEVCHWSLGQISSIAIPAGMTIHLGMVISRPSNNHFAKIAFIPEADDYAYSWRHPGQVEGEIMENGSTRFNIRDAVGCTLWLSFRTGGPWPWLSQSNCLFKRCQITSNFQDYVLVRLVRFYVTVSETAEELPTGFLFLCPRDNLCTAPSSACSPTCPAYWSLDPLGAHPLSTEEAIELGFPAVHYSVDITGRSWDSSVYAGLHQFYLAKGFDPYSQDVARHFGYPLYRLSGDIDPVFAHVVEEEDNPEVEDDLDSPMDVDHVDTENHGDDSEDLSDMELDS